MIESYFSDREKGPRPRIEEEISQSAWGGIVAAIRSRIADGSFGCKYPLECPDEFRGPCGCDEAAFTLALRGEVQDIPWPLNPHEVPPRLSVLDLLEFCYQAVGRPIEVGFHAIYGHSHYRFEPEEGQAFFREEVNRILARNGLVYELNHNGFIVRLAPEGLRKILTFAVFRTEDTDLNELLEDARDKYLNPDLKVRKESIEKLWDAWERFKTIEPGKDKKTKATALLDRASTEPKFRKVLEDEANRLTAIGNEFRIRHHETDKVTIELSEHVDYFFHRMFALIRLLLKATGRGG